MITREQAKSLNVGDTISQTGMCAAFYSPRPKGIVPIKPIMWRVSGEVKLYNDPTCFSIPIKHGLYTYRYITNDNAQMFDLIEI